MEDDFEMPKPTWSKPCKKCGATVERYRGQGDVSCSCGATYNTFGQRLRDDWHHNRSNFDDDVDDLEGYEQAALAADLDADSRG